MSMPDRDVLLHRPERVVGYHGCHREAADQILATRTFLPSTNDYDWLGFGVYFWEYAPDRAQQWADRFGAEGGVLQATVTLGRCLNLLDTRHFAGLRRTHSATVAGLQANGLPVPKNNQGRHDLDCLVVNSYCLDYAILFGEEIQTVRGCFPEGTAVFPGSNIREKTHLQIAVRDPACISDIQLVRFS